jgi:hypothetical protein
VAFVVAIGDPPIEPALPISDTFLAAEIDAKILRFKNDIFGSNLRPDHVVEQTVAVEIPFKRIHAREILSLQLVQKSATLFIRHRFLVIGHNTLYLTILSKITRRAVRTVALMSTEDWCTVLAFYDSWTSVAAIDGT